MNKKVLTLCAGFLLAGSLTAVAQETNWVKVGSAAELVNGAAYKVVAVTAQGDSILTNGTQKYNGTDYSAPVFKDALSEGDVETWTLVKGENGTFSLQLNEDSVIRYGESTLTKNKPLFTNSANNAMSFTFNPTDSLLVSLGMTARILGNGLAMADSADASKFVFYLQQNPITAPEGTTELAEVSGAVYVLDNEGNYIGVNANNVELRASNVAKGKQLVTTSATDFANLTDEAKKAYVWVEENGGLKSAYAVENVYLTINKNGKIAASTAFVAAKIENGVLSANNQTAQVYLVSSEVLPPFNYAGNYKPAETDATEIVLYANGQQAINVEGKLENYIENDAVKTVWTLDAYEISAGQYELRLKNSECETTWLKTATDYVTVENVIWGEDGEYTLPNNPIVLRAGSKWLTIDADGLKEVDSFNDATYFALGDIQEAYVEAQYLLKDRFGDHFTLGITYTDTKGTSDTNDDVDYDLTSIFEGKLVPTASVDYVAGEADYHAAQPGATEFMLVNEDGDILAVNTDEDARLSEGANNHVYPLTTISPRQWEVDQDATGDKIYVTKFRFEYVPGTDASEVEKITKIEALVNGSWVSLGCYLDKTVPTLVAASGNVALKEISIKLNAGSIVDPQAWLTQPVYYKVTVKNTNKNAAHYGEILGLDQNGDIAYVAKAKTDQTKPEGQFAIYYEDKDNDGVIEYTFTNRETGRATNVYKADYTLKGDRLYKIDDTTFAYLDGNHMDTLAIEPIKTFTSADGFDRFTADQLNGNTYNVAMNLLDETYLYTVENHNDRHRVGLDREDATDWRIAMSTVKVLDAASDEIAVVPDTVTIAVPIHYYANSTDKWVSTLGNEGKKAKYNNPNTALKVPTYVLLNTATDEYLNGKNYDEETGNAYYVCNEDEETATRVAFKQVGDSTVNLVPVGVKVNYYPYKDTDNWVEDMSVKTENAYQTYAASLCLLDNKIIGGTTSATGVLHDEDLYHATNNDLFRITETGARTYKLLEQGDNIIISLEENNDNVLYEDGEFAGIDNRLAYEINPALYVDTAYVNRVGNYRYEYLLGVNINRVDTLDDCNNPNHDHLRTVFTEGRFLVNMRDSMEAEAEENVHVNKYAYDNEPKLAFVPGYHQNDTLYLMNEAGEVISKSFIGNSAPHFAKFSFKMINEENNEFIVEVGNTAAEQIIKNEQGNWTIIKTEPTRGYLRWHNDNLVVTRNIDNAAHFTMEDTDLIATSNEEISAEEGAISVVATDGAVVIKGAAGKNVVIATILGKVVANETINSDNETIAVPAGIAVVSVDGESFKVVVK